MSNGIVVAGTPYFDYDLDSSYISNTGTAAIFEFTPCKTQIDSLFPNPCDLYESPTGRKKKNSEHFYDTIVQNGGCLLIYDIDLKIRETTYGRVDSTICGFFESPGGVRVFAKDTQWIEFYVNNQGCDSVHTIKLSNGKPDNGIRRIDGQLFSQEQNATYQWLDCYSKYEALEGETSPMYNPRKSGLYTVELRKGHCIDTPTCYFMPPEHVDHPLNDTLRLYP